MQPGADIFFLSSQVIFKSQPVWKTMNLFVGKVNTAKINKFLPQGPVEQIGPQIKTVQSSHVGADMNPSGSLAFTPENMKKSDKFLMEELYIVGSEK